MYFSTFCNLKFIDAKKLLTIFSKQKVWINKKYVYFENKQAKSR